MKPRSLFPVIMFTTLMTVGAPAAHGQSTDSFGEVHFPTSCSTAAQQQFDRALAMLHSFFFPETVKAFAAITEAEPSCAIAYWGLAVSQRPNPLVGPFPTDFLKKGWEAIEKARASGAKTGRERDWIEALAVFFKDFGKIDQRTRTLGYEAAMARLHARYPDDAEAAIFYALALNEAADLADKTYAKQLKAAAILEKLEPQLPNHPGIPHYIIHSYDYAPLAERGVFAAARCAQLAPSAPHALHMPAHIFSMVGMWEESIAANLTSVASGKAYAAKNNLDGEFFHNLHDYDFMQYAYLQLGQDGKARALMEDVGAVKKVFSPRLVTDTAIAAIPARYMLERQDWRGAAGLQVSALISASPAKAITHFARALGAARSGDLAAAQADIGKLSEIKQELEKAKQPYWAGQVEVHILAAQAWLAEGRGDHAAALNSMRAAADLEDASEKHVAMENRLYPMRELLGDLLTDQEQPTLALKEYEASMRTMPNRFRAFAGAAMAADRLGDRQQARKYYEKLVALAGVTNTERPELIRARQFLARN
jgi:tetratricopeptide (TPR) repeat protein